MRARARCDPDTVDSWAAVLARTAATPSSLWLYASPAEARGRQLAELAARGVRSSRSVSSGKLPRADHIVAMGRYAPPVASPPAQTARGDFARGSATQQHTTLQLSAHCPLSPCSADLWLDTVNYNAHGTGTDVLWAPLPPVVLSGNKIASMSFSSMACVAGACVAGVRSRREYEDFAVSLASARM
eukprot:7356356-Prymnesium_polylepis.1